MPQTHGILVLARFTAANFPPPLKRLPTETRSRRLRLASTDCSAGCCQAGLVVSDELKLDWSSGLSHLQKRALRFSEFYATDVCVTKIFADRTFMQFTWVFFWQVLYFFFFCE